MYKGASRSRQALSSEYSVAAIGVAIEDNAEIASRARARRERTVQNLRSEMMKMGVHVTNRLRQVTNTFMQNIGGTS